MNSSLSQYAILIVDDEPLIRQSLYEIIKIEGYRAFKAASAEEAIEHLKAHTIDVVITDLKLPTQSGLELLREAKHISPETETILITGFGTIESAVEAMKHGAYDYVTKPINDQEIKLLIERILEKKRLVLENKALRDELAANKPSQFFGMMGSSPSMQRVYQMISAVASSNATVLISGESGTGKGMAAKAIHACDQLRSKKPFVEVNCGALSETLLESELFGHMKGSFTGAIKDKEGRFEYAGEGSIFLDEIDAFSLKLQVKLLRVLQDGVYERVGDNAARSANARVIVATNRDLMKLIQEGEFREDLYYRVNVISIELPPLRERLDDLPLLMKAFLKDFNQANKKDIKGFSPDVVQLFKKYSWPGNIRELENAIEGAAIMCQTETIKLQDIPHLSRFQKNTTHSHPSGSRMPETLKEAAAEPEKELIIRTIEECGGNKIKAAQKLGINRTTLYNKIKKYSISI